MRQKLKPRFIKIAFHATASKPQGLESFVFHLLSAVQNNKNSKEHFLLELINEQLELCQIPRNVAIFF